MMMMTTMMLSPKTHRTYKVIVTRRPEMHHCSYNLRCSFQDKRVHLVTIRQRWHAVNLPWTNESSWKGRDRNEPSEVSTMCWSCALCFRKGSLKKSGADVFAWNKWCWRLLYTLYKLLCIHKYVCTPQNTHTQVDFCALSAHKKSLAEIVAIKKSVGRLLKRNEFAFYLNADSHRPQRFMCLCSSCYFVYRRRCW